MKLTKGEEQVMTIWDDIEKASEHFNGMDVGPTVFWQILRTMRDKLLIGFPEVVKHYEECKKNGKDPFEEVGEKN